MKTNNLLMAAAVGLGLWYFVKRKPAAQADAAPADGMAYGALPVYPPAFIGRTVPAFVPDVQPAFTPGVAVAPGDHITDPVTVPVVATATAPVSNQAAAAQVAIATQDQNTPIPPATLAQLGIYTSTPTTPAQLAVITAGDAPGIPAEGSTRMVGGQTSVFNAIYNPSTGALIAGWHSPGQTWDWDAYAQLGTGWVNGGKGAMPGHWAANWDSNLGTSIITWQQG